MKNSKLKVTRNVTNSKMDATKDSENSTHSKFDATKAIRNATYSKLNKTVKAMKKAANATKTAFDATKKTIASAMKNALNVTKNQMNSPTNKTNPKDNNKDFQFSLIQKNTTKDKGSKRKGNLTLTSQIAETRVRSANMSKVRLNMTSPRSTQTPVAVKDRSQGKQASNVNVIKAANTTENPFQCVKSKTNPSYKIW